MSKDDAVLCLDRRLFLAAGTTFCLLGQWSKVSTAATGSDAEAFVNDLASEIWEVLAQQELAEDERVKGIAQAIDAHTDTELLGRLALGRHWRQLSPEQQEAYAARFPAFITDLLARRLVASTGDIGGTMEDHFRLEGSQTITDEDTVVRSLIERGSGEPVTVEWRVRDLGDRHAVIDLSIEQVSLLISQRSEFASIIEEGRVDDLIASLDPATN